MSACLLARFTFRAKANGFLLLTVNGYCTVDTSRSTTSSTSAENRTSWKTWRLESFGQVMAHTRNTQIRAVTIGSERSFLR